MRVAAMAGVTGHVLLSVRETRVDVMHHLNHLARCVLLGFLVARSVLYMAERAIPAQRNSELTHNSRLQIFGLQYLEVLGTLLSYGWQQ